MVYTLCTPRVWLLVCVHIYLKKSNYYTTYHPLTL